MNVNNRKLFANRDARRRLSEMGGIVASMPELLGVAQQYNQAAPSSPSMTRVLRRLTSSRSAFRECRSGR